VFTLSTAASFVPPDFSTAGAAFFAPPPPSQAVDSQGRKLLLTVTRPLPRVLIVHTGGTLGMDPGKSYDGAELRGGGVYPLSLQAGPLLSDLLATVPELQTFANLDTHVVFNRDSCRIGPPEWIMLAKTLHAARNYYQAFIVVHGTDTMAYTASALSLLLAGFGKPIVLTGSQLPLSMPRSDARMNLIDSLTCATHPNAANEVCICFGGVLLRGNRARKIHSSSYNAFSSPGYPPLAILGVGVEFNAAAILSSREMGVYRPRFNLNPAVIRVPVVPGLTPQVAYGNLYGRGVRGIVLEVFGTGNLPDLDAHGWLPWLAEQRAAGLQVYLTSQCGGGMLHPELYRSGALALLLGVEAGPWMTPECSAVKMMLCGAYPDLYMQQPIAGEL
jgi:L-asparaginase